jgi:two-component system sensor histidine kinase MprB
VSLRTRIAGVSGLAVAIAVILGALLAYVAIRAELRSQVDSALRDRAADITRVSTVIGEGGNGPAFGPPPGAPPAEAGVRDRKRPMGVYRRFEKAAPAFGGAAGYLQVVTTDGGVARAPGQSTELPVDGATRAIAANGNGRRFHDVTVDGSHLRVLTLGVARLGAVQVARPLSEVDTVLHRVLAILIAMSAGGIALGAAMGGGVARAALAPVRRFTSGTEQIATSGDVSRRMEVEGDDELARMARSFNATLDELERSVEAQRHLVADAGHELRTPIASLRANIQLLEDADRLPESELAAVRSDIVQELDELTTLVADIVELARGTKTAEGEVDDVRLDMVVEQLVERASRRAGGQVSFDVDVEPTLLRAQQERVARAVSNLLDNARKWSPPGGLVEVRLRSGELSVRDHGPGFEESDLLHVFDRFFRSDRARAMAGSGLGLAIVRHAAESGGGWARASNASGGGGLVEVSFGPPIDDESLIELIREQ